MRIQSGVSGKSALDPVLVLNARGGLPPLFCLHGGSGLSWGYARLVRELGPDRPIYGIQAAIIDTESAFPASVEEMAESYAGIIQKMQPSGPYYLLGMSLGGLVAHAVACRLQDRGQEIACLAVMDAYAAVPGEVTREPGLLELFEMVQFGAEYLKDLQDNDQRVDIQTVVAAARRAGHILGLLEAGQIECMLRFLKHSTWLRKAYRPGVFRGNMLFFAATEDRPDFLSPAQWRDHVSGTIQVHELRCRHTGITDPEQITMVGKVLQDYLTETPASTDAALHAFYNEHNFKDRADYDESV